MRRTSSRFAWVMMCLVLVLVLSPGSYARATDKAKGKKIKMPATVGDFSSFRGFAPTDGKQFLTVTSALKTGESGYQATSLLLSKKGAVKKVNFLGLKASNLRLVELPSGNNSRAAATAARFMVVTAFYSADTIELNYLLLDAQGAAVGPPKKIAFVKSANGKDFQYPGLYVTATPGAVAIALSASSYYYDGAPHYQSHGYLAVITLPQYAVQKPVNIPLPNDGLNIGASLYSPALLGNNWLVPTYYGDYASGNQYFGIATVPGSANQPAATVFNQLAGPSKNSYQIGEFVSRSGEGTLGLLAQNVEFASNANGDDLNTYTLLAYQIGADGKAVGSPVKIGKKVWKPGQVLNAAEHIEYWREYVSVPLVDTNGQWIVWYSGSLVIRDANKPGGSDNRYITDMRRLSINPVTGKVKVLAAANPQKDWGLAGASGTPLVTLVSDVYKMIFTYYDYNAGQGKTNYTGILVQ